MNTIEVKIVRRLDAPAEIVFDRWLDPKTIGNWLFATPDGEMTQVALDPQVGGKFVIAEQRGDLLAEHFGTYLEIDRPQRLVFTFAVSQDEEPSRVEVKIIPDGNACTLELLHNMDAKWADYVDRTQDGWNMVLDGLDREIMENQKGIVVEAQMLIRRPIAEVFDAFIDPTKTTKFWFTRSSGPLEVGAEIEWTWEMYDVSTQAHVLAIEPNKRIHIEWDNPPCPVEWEFQPYSDDSTLVKISNWGFQGSQEEIVAQAIDSKGGFSFVLAGAKAWLEHGIELNLVGDHHPEANQSDGG